MAGGTADVAAAVTVPNMLPRLMLGVVTDTATHVQSAAMSTGGTHALVFATRPMQHVHITGIAALAGEVVVIGEVVIGIPTMDIPGLAITAWAMAIHTTGLTVTHIIIPTDTILISMDTGPTQA